jgi:hypothetical protein
VPNIHRCHSFDYDIGNNFFADVLVDVVLFVFHFISLLCFVF